jgi:hypothetical protein
MKAAHGQKLKQEVIRRRLAHVAMVEERQRQQMEMAQLEFERGRQQLEVAFQKEQKHFITLQHLAAESIRRLMEHEARCQPTTEWKPGALESIEDNRLRRLPTSSTI